MSCRAWKLLLAHMPLHSRSCIDSEDDSAATGKTCIILLCLVSEHRTSRRATGCTDDRPFRLGSVAAQDPAEYSSNDSTPSHLGCVVVVGGLHLLDPSADNFAIYRIRLATVADGAHDEPDAHVFAGLIAAAQRCYFEHGGSAGGNHHTI